MARYNRTEGICLRRLDYSNTSQVATFLTPDQGCLSFLAKGVTRAPRKGIRRGFNLLGRYELIYTQRRTGTLRNLTHRNLLEAFGGIRKALAQLLCGYYAVELALSFTIEGDSCPEFYKALLKALRRFDRGENLGLSVLVLELAALREHGSCPSFGACVECGRKVQGSGRLLFSPAQGGPLCRTCGHRLHSEGGGPALSASARDVAFLAGLAAHPPAYPGRVRVPPEQVAAASRMLRFHIRYVLGRELRMWRYLQDGHLGRILARLRRGRR
jgi:DNA repair protein RecO